MNEEMMAIFKDEIERTNLKMLADMIDKKFITAERAAEFLGMTVSEFKEAVERLKVTA